LNFIPLTFAVMFASFMTFLLHCPEIRCAIR
jgi:hypothetical protein